MMAGSGQLTAGPVPVFRVNGLVYVGGCETAGEGVLTLCADAVIATDAASGRRNDKASDLEWGEHGNASGWGIFQAH